LNRKGLEAKDALHLACAIDTKCHYFLTTGDRILKKVIDQKSITVLNPVDFVRKFEPS
jgi:predicted nucleic acid-binding protein